MNSLLNRLGLLALATAMGLTAAAAQSTKMVIGTGVDPAFAAFYIGKRAGIFEKNGLDVVLNTGPSGSAMVAFLIKGQSQAALGAEQAGIQNFNLDPNVVVAAETTELKTYWAVVGRNIGSVEELKGRRIGVAPGSGSEVFWLAMIEKLKLNPKDYNVVSVEPPEMIAAMERNNVDAFVSWEPWLTKTVRAIPGARIVRDNDGILTPRVYLYMNKAWVAANPKPAEAFMRSLMEASEMTRTKREEAARHIAATLHLDVPLTLELMDKLTYDIRLQQPSLDHLKMIEGQIRQVGKLAKPVDWGAYIYPDLLKSVAPAKVGYELPK
ncbi:ABC transporter substrate-binding protein [Enterovirga sp. CN4-39]|uniref:ABC transporter substrate-binding protein n=1 Tax=Enterovirga sp. CN4-39 TaxID=3400910 RepID=UPI003C02B25E